MTVLGLILIAGGAALAAGVLISSTDGAMLSVFGAQVNTTVAGAFTTGAVTMLAILLGLWLVTVSVRRARRRRLQLKAERARREQMESELAHERAAHEDDVSRARPSTEAAHDTEVIDVHDAAPTRPADDAETRRGHARREV